MTAKDDVIHPPLTLDLLLRTDDNDRQIAESHILWLEVLEIMDRMGEVDIMIEKMEEVIREEMTVGLRRNIEMSPQETRRRSVSES